MMHSMPSTNADTASIFSDVVSSEGVDENGEPRVRGVSSSKAAHLANEIAGMEQLVARLEERNKWLTTKLLMNRRRFIENMMMKGTKETVKSCLDSWRQAMNELRVESQLEKQTAALDQCQQVAKELGAALANEQIARKRAEEANRTMRIELERVISFNEGLQQQGEEAVRRGSVFEKRLEEAENRLQGCKKDAMAIIDNVELWEQRKLDAGREKTKQLGPSQEEDFLGRSERIRGEARDTINKVNSVLAPARDSPERERPGSRERQASIRAERPAVGALSSISRYDMGDSPVRSRQAATRTLSEQGARARAQSQSSYTSVLGGYSTSITSPVDGRFGAWQYDAGMQPIIGTSETSSPLLDSRPRVYSGSLATSMLQASAPQMLNSQLIGSQQFMQSRGSVASASGAATPVSPSGLGPSGQAQRNSQGEVLEPWWCVRRVQANGTVTMTPAGQVS